MVHYHLQSGGVTRIIENSIEALSGNNINIVVLTGQAPKGWWPGDYRVVPGLQYELVRPQISPAALAVEMEQKAKEALGGPPDIWHINNHSLGKNMALPGAIFQLAQNGHHLFLHIHDFAEDGRPNNYHLMLETLAQGRHDDMFKLLYPVAEHVHYGVINGRDYVFLKQAGLKESCLHILPNPVRIRKCEADDNSVALSDKPLWLYSTRAIRRKNLGEFLLWSAITRDGACFATTLGPENPKERPRYESWKRLAAELSLPVKFELGVRSGHGFLALLRQAYVLVTTSIAEGFGLAFLEPWLADRQICGRDLPELTSDFREDGIKFVNLYDHLGVPVSWLGSSRILDKAWVGFLKNLESYGRSPDKDAYDRLVNSWIQRGKVDFGRLDEDMQETVLRRIVKSPEMAEEINPKFLFNFRDCEEDIKNNKRLLVEKYGLRGYGERLLSIYKKLASADKSGLDYLNGNILLDLFLEPERLTLLRVD